MGFSLKKTLKKAGHAVGKAGRSVVKAVDKVGNLTKKVPIVGNAIHATYEMGTGGPIKFAAKIVSDPKNIHKAAYNTFKDHVKSVQELAPYAAGVASMVPGVGTGIAGAISAGYALSKGRKIDQALKEGVKGAIPGGNVIQGGFNAAADLSAGKKVSDVQFDPLLRKGGVNAAQFKANVNASLNGDTSAMAAVNDDLKKIREGAGSDAEDAILTGIGVGFGEKLQNEHAKAAAQDYTIANLEKEGIKQLKNPELKWGASPTFWYAFKSKGMSYLNDLTYGYKVGIGAMSFKLNEIVLPIFLKKMDNHAKELGFFAGVAAYTAAVNYDPPMGVGQKGTVWLIQKGLQEIEAPPSAAAEILKGIGGYQDYLNAQKQHAKNVVAQRDAIKAEWEHRGWFDKFMTWLGLGETYNEFYIDRFKK